MAPAAAPWEAALEGEELVHLAINPSAPAAAIPVPEALHPDVREALTRWGVTGLYSHQIDALAAAWRDEHVLVTTGTASGKSLAFNLPVLHGLSETPKLRALYVYPTKALAQDQARSLTALTGGVKRLQKTVRLAIYDGDTEVERRRQIRNSATVILTNPDMLHVGVLPHHDRWGDVFSNLRYVVLDEAHVYRGVFGSHVANVIRRLRRIAALYGAAPQFLLASATIANPAELGRELIGEPVTVVDRDGAPRAQRTIALWNPVLVDEALGLRASPLGDGARLLSTLVGHGLRTICFAKSRKAAELIHRFAAERLDRELAARLSPYRAGYTPEQRRAIENRLVAGELLGVTATDALELGIDVGLLDCAISVGFPGTVASLRQQWGRAGRREAGLAILVASEDALDQFFMREPESLLGRPVEAAILNHANPRILRDHVRSAAFEAPVSSNDSAVLGLPALTEAEALASAGELRSTPAGYVWAGRSYPASAFSLRSAGREAITIVEASGGTILGLVELERAFSTVHVGAVYLHLGESYEVPLSISCSYGARRALLRRLLHPGKAGYCNGHRETHRVERRLGIDLSFGDVSVTEQVVAFQKRSIRGQEALEVCSLSCPPQTFATEAIWFCPTDAMLDGLAELPALLGSLHAAEHCAHRTPPTPRDVRPLGHRRALDESPSADWQSDDLRLRRSFWRHRSRRARLRAVRAVGRGHREAARGLHLRAWLPLLRAVTEMRQPQRAARQKRSPHAARANARRIVGLIAGRIISGPRISFGPHLGGEREREVDRLLGTRDDVDPLPIEHEVERQRDHGPTELARQCDLRGRSPLAADGDHDVPARCDCEVARVADPRRNRVVDPGVRLAAGLTRAGSRWSFHRPLERPSGRLHHAAQSTADDGGSPRRKEAAHRMANSAISADAEAAPTTAICVPGMA